jgi:hypothetical protein
VVHDPCAPPVVEETTVCQTTTVRIRTLRGTQEGVVLFRPPPPPAACQPLTHTMTIFNGAKVEQQSFVWRNGAWQTCDVFVRDCPTSAWHLYGTYPSPRLAEQAAYSLRGWGKQAYVRQHCG